MISDEEYQALLKSLERERKYETTVTAIMYALATGALFAVARLAYLLLQ